MTTLGGQHDSFIDGPAGHYRQEMQNGAGLVGAWAIGGIPGPTCWGSQERRLESHAWTVHARRSEDVKLTWIDK